MRERVVGMGLFGLGALGTVYVGQLALGTVSDIDAIQNRPAPIVAATGSVPENVFGTTQNLVKRFGDIVSDEWTMARSAVNLGTLSTSEKQIASKTEHANTQFFLAGLSAAMCVGSGLVIAGKNPAPLAKTIVNRTPLLRGRS